MRDLARAVSSLGMAVAGLALMALPYVAVAAGIFLLVRLVRWAWFF